MTIEEVKGRAIVSLADGAKVAEVKDVLINPAAFQVTGFLLEGKPGRGFLPLGKVRAFGDDAFTLDTAEPIKWSTGNLPVEDGARAKEIVGLKVVDATGTVVGAVHDIVFDSAGGAISTFDIRSGGVFGIGVNAHSVPPSSVRGIGASLMTIESVMAEPQPS